MNGMTLISVFMVSVLLRLREVNDLSYSFLSRRCAYGKVMFQILIKIYAAGPIF